MAKEWWKTFFDENYILYWAQSGSLAHTAREVSFLEKTIPLKKDYEILDLCCGHGRHALELARRGYKVTGLDYSAYELDLARQAAKKRGTTVEFLRGDARHFKFKKKFDVIINMFTAFGYGTKEDDRKIIENVSRSLKRGGKFFIDLQSLPYLWSNFRSARHQKFGPIRVNERRTYDFLEGTVRDVRTFSRGKKKKVYKFQVRNYTLAELSSLLQEGGLRVIKFFGSYKGEPFGVKHKRMLVLAQKV